MVIITVWQVGDACWRVVTHIHDIWLINKVSSDQWQEPSSKQEATSKRKTSRSVLLLCSLANSQKPTSVFLHFHSSDPVSHINRYKQRQQSCLIHARYKETRSHSISICFLNTKQILLLSRTKLLLRIQPTNTLQIFFSISAEDDPQEISPHVNIQ